MKYLTLLTFLFLVSLNGYPKEKNGTTFLVLFNKVELKEVNSSPEYIELNFLDKFRTRSYSGNSEAALLITLSSDAMNKCDLGEMRVQVNPTTWLALQDIAYRIIDLNESKEDYRSLLEGPDGKSLSFPKNQLVRIKL